MKLLNFIKTELNNLGKYEKILFPVGILIITVISVLMKDSKIALLSAICGILYTLLAGKGRIICYLFGISATLCYAYLSFLAGLYGNFALHMAYYLPMEIVGIFNWKKHLKKESSEIIKTNLPAKTKILFTIITLAATAATTLIISKLGGQKPLYDAITCIFSILGMFLTVKRCIEQWLVWALVNAFSAIMWLELYIQGEKCFILVVKWSIYFILAIHFWHSWHKELNQQK